MATLGTIQTYIQNRLLDPNGVAVSSSEVIDAINASIQYWKFFRFWFNEVEDDATLTEGDASFPYPDDFLVPALKDSGFAISYGGVRYPLSKVSKTVYDNLYIDNTRGLPRWYAREASDEYQCFPIPNLDYTVLRHYLKDYDALVSSSDTNDFTVYAERLIKLWTLANLTQELRQDTEMASYYREAAKDEEKNLQRMTSKANSAGKVTIYSNI